MTAYVVGGLNEDTQRLLRSAFECEPLGDTRSLVRVGENFSGMLREWATKNRAYVCKLADLISNTPEFFDEEDQPAKALFQQLQQDPAFVEGAPDAVAVFEICEDQSKHSSDHVHVSYDKECSKFVFSGTLDVERATKMVAFVKELFGAT